MDVPIYIAEFQEGDQYGIKFTSITETPAIRMKYLAFAEKAKEICFISNDVEQIIAGPSMMADMPILRIENGQKYYVVIPAETIKKSVQKLARESRFNAVDIEHNGVNPGGIFLYEMFIIDRARGINPPDGFENLTDGSLWQGYHIPDPMKFEAIKNNFQGFSVQVMYDLIPSMEAEESLIMAEINRMLDTVNAI